jgi:hypothetical protein
MNNTIVKSILTVIIGILLFLLAYQQFILLPKKIAKQVKEITLLQHSYDSSQYVINSLKNQIKQDSLTVLSLDNNAADLTIKYNMVQNELDELKAKKGKKDPVIKKYNVVEIESSLQNRYNDHSKPDSIVTVSKNIGQEILVDLDYYDIIRKEIPIYDSMHILLNKKIKVKDSIITIQNASISNYNRILSNYSNQRDVLIKERNDAEKATRKQKTKTVISQILAGAALVLYILK